MSFKMKKKVIYRINHNLLSMKFFSEKRILSGTIWQLFLKYMHLSENIFI